jgi:hypothetical protein
MEEVTTWFWSDDDIMSRHLHGRAGDQDPTDTHLFEKMKTFAINRSRSLHAKRRSNQWAHGIKLRPVNLLLGLLRLWFFDKLVNTLGHLSRRVFARREQQNRKKQVPERKLFLIPNTCTQAKAVCPPHHHRCLIIVYKSFVE